MERVQKSLASGSQKPYTVSGRPLTHAERLVAAVDDRRQAQLVERAAVLACREDGMTWDAIGRTLGITGEGARRRYGA